MDVSVCRDPAFFTPRQHLLNLDDDLPDVRRHLDSLPHGPDLEPLRYLDVHPAQRQVDRRLTGDVRAGVGAAMAKVHAIVLEPGRVEDAMAVDRCEVLSPLAVDVQLDRYRSATAPLHGPQCDPLRRRRYRLQGT